MLVLKSDNTATTRRKASVATIAYVASAQSKGKVAESEGFFYCTELEVPFLAPYCVLHITFSRSINYNNVSFL